MSNLIAIEAPTSLQASPAKAGPAPETKTGQNANAIVSNLVGDDVQLAAQGRLDNVRAIMAAINESQGDDEGLMGAKTQGALFSFSPITDEKSANELINLSMSQILSMPSVLVPTGLSPQALLGLIK